jgi:hypothetical protein
MAGKIEKTVQRMLASGVLAADPSANVQMTADKTFIAWESIVDSPGRDGLLDGLCHAVVYLAEEMDKLAVSD